MADYIALVEEVISGVLLEVVTLAHPCWSASRQHTEVRRLMASMSADDVAAIFAEACEQC